MASTAEAGRQSQMAAQIEQLEINSGRLGEVIRELMEYLGPVLRAGVQAVSNEKDAPLTELTPHATRLRSVNMSLEETATLVTDTIARLEV